MHIEPTKSAQEEIKVKPQYLIYTCDSCVLRGRPQLLPLKLLADKITVSSPSQADCLQLPSILPMYFKIFIYLIYLFSLFFWLHWVLVAAAVSFIVALGLFVAALGLLSSCGGRVFSL